jgi:hypothetical protein
LTREINFPALASTIGTNATVDGFDYGSSQIMNSSWVKQIAAPQAAPFNWD